MHMHTRVTWIALGTLMLLGAGSAAALSPADKCESSELKTSGKYSFCRLKADAKAVKTGDPPDYSKCDEKFTDKFGAAEMEGMGQCPSSAPQAQIQAFITQCTDDVVGALGGAPLPVCQPPPLRTGQTTAYGAGTDGDLQKGASQSFTDNGDGTITDDTTGLMWEKKTDDGSIHDKDDTYTWCGASCFTTNIMDGTITTMFLAALNGGSGFAGHTDWRIPNANELESIRNLENANPATYSAFNAGCAANCTVTMCSCTQPDFYWSSTTYPSNRDDAWFVQYLVGILSAEPKNNGHYVRAVRAGS